MEAIGPVPRADDHGYSWSGGQNLRTRRDKWGDRSFGQVAPRGSKRPFRHVSRCVLAQLFPEAFAESRYQLIFTQPFGRQGHHDDAKWSRVHSYE